MESLNESEVHAVKVCVPTSRSAREDGSLPGDQRGLKWTEEHISTWGAHGGAPDPHGRQKQNHSRHETAGGAPCAPEPEGLAQGSSRRGRQ